MEEKAMGFNEGQLKRTGFAEAFTPELKAQMEKGSPLIQQPFKKEYDGDQVTATLHLKKSSTSDYYFLNKFDLSLLKEGQTEPVKQVFYLTRKASDGDIGQKQQPENKYTLKEGYNLLAGRPVFKNLVSNEGHKYQAWIKLNFSNVLNNGNHELKQYHTNYGFELENILAKYPIKELANDQYRQSLIDSLHRGNLQKVTFVGKEGNEEKLYVSPNITLGALNVYDTNKQRIATESLMERNYIGKDLSDKLKEHVAQQQKPVPHQNGDTEEKASVSQTQVGEKQKDEKLVKRPSRKQKLK